MLVDMKEKGTLDSNFFPLLEEYSALTKGHMWKENDILYPMARDSSQLKMNRCYWSNSTKLQNRFMELMVIIEI